MDSIPENTLKQAHPSLSRLCQVFCGAIRHVTYTVMFRKLQASVPCRQGSLGQEGRDFCSKVTPIIRNGAGYCIICWTEILPTQAGRTQPTLPASCFYLKRVQVVGLLP